MAQRAAGLTAEEFVEKWSKAALSERAASHEHFLDLCHLLNQPTPAQADATGEDYCFEKHVKVVGSASKGSKGDFGFVDVWKRGHFAWEYKRKDKHKTLDEAYRQLYQYRDDLDNPPLSVVCDIRTTEIRAHFPGYPTTKTVIQLEEIPGRLELLRRLFTAPHSFKPAKTREEMTSDLADTFGDLADKLLSRSDAIPATLWHGAGDPVAHFLMKVMFCLFARGYRPPPPETLHPPRRPLPLRPRRVQALLRRALRQNEVAYQRRLRIQCRITPRNDPSRRDSVGRWCNSVLLGTVYRVCLEKGAETSGFT